MSSEAPEYRPGPWRLSKYRDGTSIIVIDDEGFDVATVHYPNRDASAALIASAPDLYDALVSLTAVARRYLQDYDEHPEIQKADDAIAKVYRGTPAPARARHDPLSQALNEGDGVYRP